MRLPLIPLLAALASAGLAAAAPVPPPEPRLNWQWREMEGPYTGGGGDAAFSPDGKLVAFGMNDQIVVWSVVTGKQVMRMQLPKVDHNIRLVFTADGKQLVSDCSTEAPFRIWDVKTGKQLREVVRDPESHNDKLYHSLLAFSPDGATALDREHGYGPAAPHLSLIALSDGTKRKAGEYFRGSDDAFAGGDFAPDGKTFAFYGPANRLRIYDTATTKLVRELRPENDRNARLYTAWGKVRYSPDGHFLVAYEAAAPRVRDSAATVPASDTVAVAWGAADGRRYLAWPTWNIHSPPRFGPGNRYLLGDARGVLTDARGVYDLLTDETVLIGNNPTDQRRLIGASADGETLVFQGRGTADRQKEGDQLVLWLASAPILPQPIRAGDVLKAADAEKLWAGLVADNLFRREHCAGVLRAKPDWTMELAKARLRPEPAANTVRLAKLVADLDDDALDVREKAQTELETLGRRFEPAVAAALKAAPAGEVRNRLTVAARKIAAAGPTAELTADLRVVEFLKSLDTSAAREHLTTVAAGASGARLTLEAKAAVGK